MKKDGPSAETMRARKGHVSWKIFHQTSCQVFKEAFPHDPDPVMAGNEVFLMTLHGALKIDLNVPELISLVGAGGKTSTMFVLAQEFKAFGKKVLVTTTTNIAFSETSRADRLVIESSKDICSLSRVGPGTIVCLGRGTSNDNGKLKGIDPEFIDAIYQEHLFDYVVVEADGSKRRPIKAPAHYEPVIPGETTQVIGVIGLDALGETITEAYVHRPNLFCSITGKEMGDTIDRQCLIKLILSADGLFKDVPQGCGKYVILNKADHGDREKEAERTVHELIEMQAPIHGLIIAATDKNYISAEWSSDNAR
jgi:probable selenium-dependent hydroxylase accessory protein YqeC